MKNYKITYFYDGYRFYDVVRAESAEKAIEYLMWDDSERHGCKAEETDEEPSYIVPEGWVKTPKPHAESSDEFDVIDPLDEEFWN